VNFPDTIVSPVNVPDPIWWEFEQRLCLVYIGKPHTSSEIHERVIKKLGKNAHQDHRIEQLRTLAEEAKNAFQNGNFTEFGRVMNSNTDVQRALHPDLVCEKAEEIIETGRMFGAIGSKVNGAGGDGGSVTLLFGEDRCQKRKFLDDIKRKNLQHLPIYLSRKGLRVW
jgi:D-glycero-alpha-D-manno-heptose-7-phosphate kinase